jgi:hypothetical protein
MRYEVGFYNPEDDILHSHRRENLKSYIEIIVFAANLKGTDRIVYFCLSLLLA